MAIPRWKPWIVPIFQEPPQPRKDPIRIGSQLFKRPTFSISANKFKTGNFIKVISCMGFDMLMRNGIRAQIRF